MPPERSLAASRGAAKRMETLMQETRVITLIAWCVVRRVPALLQKPSNRYIRLLKPPPPNLLNPLPGTPEPPQTSVWNLLLRFLHDLVLEPGHACHLYIYMYVLFSNLD